MFSTEILGRMVETQEVAYQKALRAGYTPDEAAFIAASKKAEETLSPVAGNTRIFCCA